MSRNVCALAGNFVKFSFTATVQGIGNASRKGEIYSVLESSFKDTICISC